MERIDRMRSSKWVLVGVFFIVLFGLLYGENGKKPDDPSTHVKGTYVSEDGKLYVAGALPAQLFLFSGAAGQKTLPMVKSKKKSLSGTIKLKEGLNILQLSGSGAAYHVYSDSMAPKTKPIFSLAPKHESKSTVYYGKGMIFDLVSQDNLSGVRARYLSIDGQPFQLFQQPLKNFSVSGKHRFRYYSVDHVGNVEEMRQLVFYFDSSTPATKLHITGTHQDNVLSPQVSISLCGSDDFSGVKEISYRIDDGKIQVYRKPLPVKKLSGGNHTIHYFSKDHVNNVEQSKSYRFYYDKSPPRLTINVEGSNHRYEGTVFVAATTKVHIDAEDDKAGVSRTFYRIDDAKEQTFIQPFPLPKQSGIHRIIYTAVDHVMNKRTPQLKEYYLDLAAPGSKYRLTGSYSRYKDGFIINKDTNIQLSSTDLEAGVKVIYYRIGTGAWLVYEGSLKIKNEGVYTLSYFAVDHVDNREPERELRLHVDNRSDAAGITAPKSVHPKQWQPDENNRPVGPANHPFYLLLSSDPERKEGPTLIMDIQRLSQQLGRPIVFKKGGVHAIRFSAGGKRATFRLSIDNQKPVTHARFSGAPKYVASKHVYYGPGLVLTLTATDKPRLKPAGLSQTLFSLDGSAFTGYEKPLTVFSRDKRYVCRYYSVDRTGNIETMHEQVFLVDTTAPATVREVENAAYGKVFSPRSSIRLTSEDNLSGVRGIYYQIDKGKERTYTGELTGARLNALAEGKHVLRYYAKDKVGNREEVQEFPFTLDKRLPQVSFKVVGDLATHGGMLYLSQRSKLKLSPSPKAGNIRTIAYQIDMLPEARYHSSVPLPLKSGNHKISYYGSDRLGNKSFGQVKNLFLDLQPPKTQVSLKGPRFMFRRGLTISPRTIIQLQAGDNASGVKSILYRIDGGPEKNYTGSFTLVKSGGHRITYYAVDLVNNREQPQSVRYIVDRQPPKLKITYNITPRKEAGSDVLIFPENVLIFLVAEDGETEVDKVTYSIDNKQKVLYRNPLSNFKAGKVINLKAFAIDRLSNGTQEQIKFKIEKWKR
jgi:hypothetical protein